MSKAVSKRVSNVLLDGLQSVREDRVDDLMAQYPEDKFTRHDIQQWIELDPSRNKKFVPWIVKQVAHKTLKLPDQGMQLRDDLMSFERILKLPAYQGNRDIYQFETYANLHDTISQYGGLRSKGEVEREKRQQGVEVVAHSGNLSLLKITNVQALINWSWKAYDPAQNPNWTKAKVSPKIGANGEMNADLSDHLWCVRFPSYATSYLQGNPFYMVLKNGGPYAGIIFDRGECQDLKNNYDQPDHHMKMSQVEEIFPVIKQVIPDSSILQGRCKVFSNLRFLHNDVKDGETVAGPVELAGTSLVKLPNNLTVKGNLDISGTKVTTLPAGLRVEGSFHIYDTAITTLPDDLFVEDMEWSDPLPITEVKAFYYRVRYSDMREHYLVHAKHGPRVTAAQRVKKWNAYQPTLKAHFQVAPDIDTAVKTVFRYRKPTAKAKEPEEAPAEADAE